MTTPYPPIFDGHNDTLMVLYENDPERGPLFFQRGEKGHLDLPRAREGGLAGGLFAVFVDNPPEDGNYGDRRRETEDGYEVALPPAIGYERAIRTALAQIAILLRLERLSEGQVRVVRSAAEIEACMQAGVFAAVLHLEGAEAIDPGLDALDVLYQAGLRSVGPVWSRPNIFGHGVPFKFPTSPDIGPGLTEAGKALVKACNRLGILVDLAHLNEKGFWDVAALSDAPLVATHTAANALCRSARNLTDRQIDAIADSGGVIGISFFVADLRPDSRYDLETPLTLIADHARYIADRVGVDHVALGSDFNGARVPQDLGDASGLPRLLDALRAAGFDEDELRQVAYQNWLRVLRATWRG